MLSPSAAGMPCRLGGVVVMVRAGAGTSSPAKARLPVTARNSSAAGHSDVSCRVDAIPRRPATTAPASVSDS
ncbi:hypothetical protein AWW66_00995 [Micromonospora rosaria]|uniref:Uncharacterized protein n=1 Tax=Micromonospora rosaria TaxID=47874 RepID=A0A136PZB2_9ACTN|nr:hypothetical protein AWW66_00995 [Micromonospora rosaria]